MLCTATPASLNSMNPLPKIESTIKGLEKKLKILESDSYVPFVFGFKRQRKIAEIKYAIEIGNQVKKIKDDMRWKSLDKTS